MASLAPHRPPSRDPSRTGIAAQLPAGPDPQDLKQLASAMAAAAVTLQRLPRAAGDGPAGARSAWPDMVRATRFAIFETRRATQPRPSPSEIDAMEQMIALLWEINGYQRQLVWARACGVRWAVLQDRYRRSRTTLNRDYRAALTALAGGARAETAQRGKQGDRAGLQRAGPNRMGPNRTGPK